MMSDTAVAVSSGRGRDGLRDWFGRGLNSRSELYKLPADRQEMNRLSLQHRIWKLMVGGLYPIESEEAVMRALNINDGSSEPTILDIGSGSGNWAVEMALLFPHARVIGIDLIESRPRFKPSNCSFHIADATKGLDDFEGQFNIVHCRSVAGHVSDPVGLTQVIGKCLKPGGVFLSADACKSVFRSDKVLYKHAQDNLEENDESRSWFSRWMWEVTNRWTSKGHTHTEGDKLSRLIREDGQFYLLGENTYWSPMNWAGENVQNGSEIGKLMVINAIDFMQASKPALLSGGIQSEIVESWIKHAQLEVLNPLKHMYMKWVVTWAVKQ